MRFFKRLSTLLICLSLHEAVGGTIHYLTYGNGQGLPSNLTKDIRQDAVGFIWIGSDAGLARFDGTNFVTYTHQLPSRFVKQLALDRARRLLVVTDMGIVAVEEKGSVPVFSTLLPAAPTHADTTLFFPKGVYEAHDGTLWISEPDAVVKYSNGTLHRYPFAEQYRADSYARSFQIVEDRQGTIFVLSERGYLFRYDAQRDGFEQCRNERQDAPFLIDAVLEDSSGAFIIGGSKGVYTMRVNSAAGTFRLQRLASIAGVSSLVRAKDGSIFAGTWLSGLYRLEEKNRFRAESISRLPLRVINNLAIGRDGEIWVSSDEGIALVADTYFVPVPLDLTNYYIEAIAGSPDGALLATDGKTVVRIEKGDEAAKGKKIFTGTESLILSLATDGSTVWIGYRDGFLTELKNGKAAKHLVPFGSNRLLTFLFMDNKKNLWICQDGLRGVYKRAPDSRMTYYGDARGVTSHIGVVRQAADGTIWCGGTGASSYLYAFDEAGDRFINKSVPLTGQGDAFTVDDLAADSSGRIWLGTTAGLYVCRNGRIAHPDGYELFHSEPVKSMAIDRFNHVWLGTDRGVLRYADHEVSRFDGRDGLTSMTMAYRACVIDHAQQVWLGTAHGISRWNQAADREGRTPTPVFVGLSMNGAPIVVDRYPAAPCEFEYRSYFTAVTAALTYPSDRILYRYRIRELSQDWSTPGPSSTVVIPQLEAGSYTVEISAQQPGYLWSEPASFTFAIAPPFYRTWWAYLSYLIFLGIGGGAALKFRSETVERRKLRSALSESENDLRALFNTMHDIYFQLDLTGRILDIAPSVVIHSGYTRDELLGTDAGRVVFHPEEKKKLMMKLVRSGEIIDHELLMRQRSGGAVWVSINAQVVKNGQGRMVALRGVMREITSRRQLEDDLRQNLKRERELNELKSRFVSMVSHEFRTPLTTILSSTQLLERYGQKWDEVKAERAAGHYKRIQESIQRMTLLLDDVLFIGKAEAGKLEFAPKPLNLTALCAMIVDEINSTLDGSHRGIQFRPQIPDEASMLDEKLVRQIVTNLLSNAIKYSPEGAAVTFELVERQGGVVLSVKDRGIGIPERDRERLFESFHRSANVGNIRGTGLGLAIVKQCVDLHGGSIDVASTEGEGSTFTVTLPLSAPKAA